MKIAWFFFLVLISEKFPVTCCYIIGNKLLWGKSTKNIHWEEDRKNASEKLNNMEEVPRENVTNQKALCIFCKKT